jgi:hypothetical protein
MFNIFAHLGHHHASDLSHSPAQCGLVIFLGVIIAALLVIVLLLLRSKKPAAKKPTKKKSSKK